LKKTIAVALLAIYLCNIGGQLVIHQYFSYLADKFFIEQADKGFYNKGDLAEVKIPVNMPNIADWPDFLNVTGQIQFENVSYNYVKMRVTRTAIYFKCEPNYSTTHLNEQNIIVAKNIKGPPITPKDHVPFSKKALLTQLTTGNTYFEFTVPVEYSKPMVVQLVQPVPDNCPAIPDQPPRSIC
jgi:hypothetical protein